MSKVFTKTRAPATACALAWEQIAAVRITAGTMTRTLNHGSKLVYFPASSTEAYTQHSHMGMLGVSFYAKNIAVPHLATDLSELLAATK
ncbi:MAG TPA: hypothetical protein VNC39_04405 [Acidocella sp.]|jgi:hypothetical protein|uniref:hypothetical protein n=1 Tax=Acidocella sp. TaxID=50710 RepID=UPI002BBCAEBD|nr:hypothetical protein [Acidocella sp.]HVE21194.1 hypothetical protein [Acidocella sp.]